MQLALEVVLVARWSWMWWKRRHIILDILSCAARVEHILDGAATWVTASLCKVTVSK